MSHSSTKSNRLLLAADVGGTKTLLQLRTVDADGHHVPVAEQRYQSRAFDSLEGMIGRFISESDSDSPDSACLAVAGPVQQQEGGQSARLTNLPWELDTRRMAESLAIPRIALLNDFQAVGYSLDELESSDLVTLQQRPHREGAPRLVVGAGTGLGVCTLFPDRGRYVSYPSEGGHMAFAPRNALQSELLAFLQRHYSRVSCERLVSGTGLVNIYRFLLDKKAVEGDTLLAETDPAAAIGEQAVAASHPLAVEAVNLFSSIYGAVVGDLALATLPAGGVYIAGGIAPKLISYLQDGPFMEAYLDKGRMSGLVQSFPLQVISNPRSGLLGAAHYAARL